MIPLVLLLAFAAPAPARVLPMPRECAEGSWLEPATEGVEARLHHFHPGGLYTCHCIESGVLLAGTWRQPEGGHRPGCVETVWREAGEHGALDWERAVWLPDLRRVGLAGVER